MAFWNQWAPRPTVAARRGQAARHVADAKRRGRPLAPITVEGRKIATTFWGASWCDNLERYQDYAYRLDRGRSYVRSGAVVDLVITPSRIDAQVLGSSLYRVTITIAGLEPKRWAEIQRGCRGHIGSLVDLLAGSLSPTVMGRLCAAGTGMFPEPAAIELSCSCPDYATMCKHVAAAMYGVGARLDHDPALLFTLRGVSADELLATAARDGALTRPTASQRILAPGPGLDALFGIELASGAGDDAPAPTAPGARPRRAKAEPPAQRKAVQATRAKAAQPAGAKPAQPARAQATRAQATRAQATRAQATRAKAARAKAAPATAPRAKAAPAKAVSVKAVASPARRRPR